jgi:radical SAM-linked protein
MPKVSFSCALPVGTESLQETLDIQLAEATDTSDLKKRINKQLPQGIDVISIEASPWGKKKARIKKAHFHITITGAKLKERNLKRFLESDYFPIVKRTKKGEHSIDARHLVEAISFISSDKLEIVLKHTEGPQLKPEEIMKGIFPAEDLESRTIRILKTRQKLNNGLPEDKRTSVLEPESER